MRESCRANLLVANPRATIYLFRFTKMCEFASRKQNRISNIIILQ